MRLIKYLKERRVKKALIDKARKELSKKYSVEKGKLEFLDIWEAGLEGMSDLLLFNITDKKHKRYGSTVAHKI